MRRERCGCRDGGKRRGEKKIRRRRREEGGREEEKKMHGTCEEMWVECSCVLFLRRDGTEEVEGGRGRERKSRDVDVIRERGSL